MAKIENDARFEAMFKRFLESIPAGVPAVDKPVLAPASKPVSAPASKPAHVLTVTLQRDGETLVTWVCNPMTFKSGNTGYNANGKLAIGGKRHQVGMNIVLLDK